MKTDELPESVRNRCHRLCGAMNLPNLEDYISVEDFLDDVTGRVSHAKSLIKEATINLGGR